MEKGESPEVDQSAELEVDVVSLYQFLIGALQWVVTLGRHHILVAVMTLFLVRINACEGHVGRVK
jgi:hypothetical protein